jgi:hypothetical protein
MNRLFLISAALFMSFLPRDSAAAEKVIARMCFESGECDRLVVRNDMVEFVPAGTPSGRRSVGHYVPEDQALVPQGEAPILDLKSATGWHIVVSAGFIYGGNPLGPSLAVYLFDRTGRLAQREKLQLRVESYEVGDLFGQGQEFLQITSGGEHAYVVNTYVWLLAAVGPPKLLVSAYGMLDRIQTANAAAPGGLWIAMQTYDGIHSETKGWRPQFWQWDPQHLRFDVASGR